MRTQFFLENKIQGKNSINKKFITCKKHTHAGDPISPAPTGPGAPPTGRRAAGGGAHVARRAPRAAGPDHAAIPNPTPAVLRRSLPPAQPPVPS